MRKRELRLRELRVRIAFTCTTSSSNKFGEEEEEAYLPIIYQGGSRGPQQQANQVCSR